MMGRWMRRIWPFPQAALFVLLAISVLSLFVDLQQLGRDEFGLVSLFLMVLGFSYGALRAGYFYPDVKKDYGRWLATTPWHSLQRLPFGSVELIPQDAAVAVIYVAASRWLAGTYALGIAVILLVLIGYYLTIASICESKHSGMAGYAIVLCMAFAMAFAFTPWLALFFLLPCELFARWGVANSLRQFPEWSGQLDGEQRLPPEWLKRDGRMIQGSLGWPHGFIHPHSSLDPMPLRTAALTSIQIGIWVWAIIHLICNLISSFAPSEPGFAEVYLQRVHPLIIVFGGCVALARTFFYIMTLRPALTLWGRVMTGRFIIPSYDRVFVVPLLLFAIGCGMGAIGSHLQLTVEAFVPACVMILSMIAFTAGPSHADWRLTAACRMTPRWISNNTSLLETK